MYLEIEKHSTLAGYAQGCRGKTCPAKMSCEKAVTRYRWDRVFRRAIDSGLSGDEYFSQLAEHEAAEKAANAAQIRHAAKEERDAARRKARQDALDERRAARDATAAAKAEAKAKAPAPSRARHGTRNRFYQGHCRVHEDCPNFGTDKPTCWEFVEDYKRVSREVHAGNVAASPKIRPSSPRRTSFGTPAEHGTMAGYRKFRTHDCPNEGTEQLTCQQAALEHDKSSRVRLAGVMPASGKLPPHGTTARYRSRRFPCTRKPDCPNWGTEKKTCAEVRNEYFNQRRRPATTI